MSSDNITHLYTYWNPNFYAKTIEDHIITLKTECLVKWLILYSEEVRIVPKKQPVNLRDLCTDRVLFTCVPWDKEISRINKQARESETLLYLQCFNLFSAPLYVGKIDKIERVTDNTIKLNDPLIPTYYYDLLSRENVRAYYSVALSDMRQVRLNEISNLTPVAEFQSAKYQFAYPFMVHQNQPREFFKKSAIAVIGRIEIEERTGKKGGYVIKPYRGNNLKLSDKEMELIRFIHNRRSKTITINTIANSFERVPQYVRNLVNRTNKKFIKWYNRPLIIKPGRSRYSLQTKIKFIKS